jgi:hypothetical protein
MPAMGRDGRADYSDSDGDFSPGAPRLAMRSTSGNELQALTKFQTPHPRPLSRKGRGESCRASST